MYQGCTKDGTNWGGWYRISGETFNAPATTQTLGKLWWAHKGTDNNMYLKYSNTGASTRGYYSYMLWDNPGFGYNDTYEQDIHLYNYNSTNINDYGKVYLNTYTTSAPECLWTPKYATSSLPHAYLDTRLDYNGCDSNNGEITYTLGSGKSRNIQSNTWYTNYMEIQKGDYDKPIVKVKAQLGFQLPAGCTSTWCSFGYDGKYYFMINFPKDRSEAVLINRNLTYPYWAFKFKK